MRIITECPENILHLEAGYIYADCRSSTLSLLQSGGGPYIYRQLSTSTLPTRALSLTCHSVAHNMQWL